MVDNGITALWIHAENNITPASPLHNTVNGGTFADTHGWYGAPKFDLGAVESIVDHNITSLFIRTENNITPANPQNSTTNGGTFADTHGWYGNLSMSGDAHPDHGSTGIIPTYENSLLITKHYLMQAYESGGGCSGNIQRIWISAGVLPDLTAIQYTGSRCTPPGTFSNFSILAIW
jgi:hypothetical protein